MCERNISYYIKELLKISAPIIMGNLGFILIGIGDVVVAGRHSTDTFAAISIATAILNCIFTIVATLRFHSHAQIKVEKSLFFRIAGISQTM